MSEALTQYSAGGIVYRHHGSTIEVVMIRDSYGRWTFPKGHVEEGETLEETAKREIAEETGLDEHSLYTKLELGEMDYWFNSTYKSDIEHHQKHHPTGSQNKARESVLIHKYVTYFLFETDTTGELSAQEGEVTEIAWIPLSKVDEHNEYEDNRELIDKAKNYLAHQNVAH